ncbi:MAG: hypothetical protein QXG98_01225 [Candidatus Micrarchaeia archaeon]
MRGQSSVEAMVVLAAYLAFLFLLISSLSASARSLSEKHAALEAKAISIRSAAIQDALATNARQFSHSFDLGNCTTPVDQVSCYVRGKAASTKVLGALNASLYFLQKV